VSTSGLQREDARRGFPENAKKGTNITFQNQDDWVRFISVPTFGGYSFQSRVLTEDVHPPELEALHKRSERGKPSRVPKEFRRPE